MTSGVVVSNKVLLKTSILFILAKALNVLSSLSLTAVLTRKLSDYEFGVWSILLSIFNLLFMLDFGLGMGLRNRMSEYINEDNIKSQKESFFALFYFYLFAAILLSVLSTAFWGLGILKVFPDNSYNLALLIVLVVSFFNLPFSVSGSVFYSYLETYINAYIDVLLSLLKLVLSFIIFVFALSFIDIVRLFYVVIFFCGFLSLLLFLKRRKWSFLHPRLIPYKEEIYPIFKLGMLFALIQAGALLIGNTDSIIIGSIVSVEKAGEFFLVQKLFLLLLSFNMVFLQPYWSAFSHKYLKKDYPWIKAILIKLTFFSFVVLVVGGGGIVTLGEKVILLWTGKTINSFSWYLFLWLWCIVSGFVSLYSVYLNGINRLKRQAIFLISGGVINIPLSVVLGKIWGVTGVVFASILIYLPLFFSNIEETIRSLENG